MRILVTGGAGFIGSHLTDKLVELDHNVIVLDTLCSGYREQINPAADFVRCDITNPSELRRAFEYANPQIVFHLAAIARTPWCIEDPVLAGLVNSHGTLCVLESCRQSTLAQPGGGVRRVVLASSNVIYAAMTPYRASKEMVVAWGKVYHEMYQQSVLSLVFSNVYGPRQSEEGPSPNVFAALRKCKREKSYLEITGDGEQSRDFTHVSDIVRGLIAASESDYCGEAIDLCTGKNWTLNQVAAMFGGEVRYLPERPGDVKHIRQDPARAKEILGWEAEVQLPNGIKDCLDHGDSGAMKYRVSIRNGKLIEPWRIRAARNLFIFTFSVAVWTCDRMPWFLCKPLMNWLLGIEAYSDLMQSDRVAHGGQLATVKF